MKIRIEEAAALEAREASDRFDSERPGLGLRFLEAIDEALREITVFPRASARIGKGRREIRQKSVDCFPYVVICELHDDEIDVLAIAHTSRKPGYWRRRGH